MRRLGAIETTFRCPFTLAQRALCAVAILARAAALIVRRSRVTPVLFNPLSALIAVSRAFTCRAALSRSAFNCTSMSMCLLRARIVADTNRSYADLCINVNSTRIASGAPERSQPFSDCSVQSLRRLKAQTGLRIEVGSINAQYAPEFRHLLISRLMPAVIYNVPEFRHQINDRTLGRGCTSQPGATENQDSENGQDGGDSISVTLADNSKIVGQPFA